MNFKLLHEDDEAPPQNRQWIPRRATPNRPGSHAVYWSYLSRCSATRVVTSTLAIVRLKTFTWPQILLPYTLGLTRFSLKIGLLFTV